MIKHRKILSLKIFLLLVSMILINSSFTYSQQEREDDPRTWKYFKILARAQDDSVFIKLQEELGVEPILETYVLVVNILDPNTAVQYVVIGDETSPDASRYLWSDLSPEVQKALLNWTGSNKENLNKKKLTYTSVFVDVVKKIKLKDVVAPPARERDILSTTAYINPYFQIFGGDPLGIPIKKSVGLSFQVGTPYSGPLETDYIATSFHILGVSIGVSSRLDELVLERGGATDTDYVVPTENLANYNNLFTPAFGLQFSYVIPFGNFFEVGFFSTIDTGGYYPPQKVLNLETGQPMPNNVVNGTYTNFEFRYPFRVLGSTRAKVYFAQFFGEKHLGFLGREMRLAGSLFDLRMDATFKGKRDFQFLIEPIISNLAEGFALSSFAIGPSFRFGTRNTNKFGLLTILVNMRLKIGDFFDERYGK